MRRLGELSYEEAARAFAAGAVGLWPIGSTEAHGPHLPLETDLIIAEESCRRAAPVVREHLGLEALLLPPLAFTVTDFAAPFAGTLSLPKETVVAYVRDAARAMAASGLKAVCLVNAHLEPAHRFALRDAVKAAAEGARCPVVLADPCDRRWVPTLTEEFQRGACHAGQYETSLVLAAGRAVSEERRALPRLDLDLMAAMKAGARDFAEAGARQAYFGDPAAATRAEGDATYAQLAAIVGTVLAEALGR